MPNAFDGFAMDALDIIVAPHRLELRTEPAEFIDQRFDFRGGACARRVQSDAPTTNCATLSQSVLSI